MENHLKPQEKENPPPPSPSPNTTSSSNSGNNTNGAPSPRTPPPPLTPKTITTNPYPTTFIQADTSSFKQVVQMLTGSAETTAKHAAPKNSLPPSAKATGPKKPSFKLYERRSSMRNLKMISPLVSGFPRPCPSSPSPRTQPEIVSPSTLDFPALALSPVTPLINDSFNRPPEPGTPAALSAEDRAIAEKRFYLHPSPRTTLKDAEPRQLLPLFPVASPRVSSGSP